MLARGSKQSSDRTSCSFVRARRKTEYRLRRNNRWSRGRCSRRGETRPFDRCGIPRARHCRSDPDWDADSRCCRQRAVASAARRRCCPRSSSRPACRQRWVASRGNDRSCGFPSSPRRCVRSRWSWDLAEAEEFPAQRTGCVSGRPRRATLQRPARHFSATRDD